MSVLDKRDDMSVNVDVNCVERTETNQQSPRQHGDYNNDDKFDSSDDEHDMESSLPLGKAIKMYPKVVTYCVLLSIVVLGWGFDLVVIGSIIGVESFQRDYGEIYEGKRIIPAIWLSLWTASTPLGMAIGTLFGGWFQDVVGRRKSLFTGSIITAAGVVVIFVSHLLPDMEAKRGVFFGGKVIQGFSIGLLKVTAMTYMSETAPTCLRGSAMALVPTGNLLGQLLGSIVVYLVNNVEGSAGYLGAFGSQFILAVAPFVIACFIPESPAFLEEKGRSDGALRSAERLYAPRADHLRALDRIKNSIAMEREMTSNASYLTCFGGKDARRTNIVILANLFSAMFGLDLVGKSSYFLQLLGLASSTSLLILIGGIVAGTAGNAVGVWVMSRFGRRPSTIASFTVAAILWGGMGVSGFWKTSESLIFTCVAMILIVVVCGMGAWPAGYAIMGETSSLRLRAKTQAIGGVAQQACSVLMSFVLPYTYNPDAGNLGGKTGFIFFGLCLLGIVTCWAVLPEMKGRTIMEIDRMFHIKLPARQFKHWKEEEEEES
jgi:MFS transporter, SP family, general alpha glucoside:H+ symporter